MSESNSPPEKILTTQQLRQQIDEALAGKDVDAAQDLAAQLAQRKSLGPWEKTVIGRAALAANNFTKAHDWLSKAAEVLSDEGSILVDLAAATAGLKRWKQAAELVGKAIAQRPDIPDLHERHAIYLANAGDQFGSRQALERALELDSARASSWALLGERRVEMQDLTAAEEAFLTALQHQPDNSAALWNLALLKEKTADLSAALGLLDRIPTETAQTAQARHRRGQILLSLGRLEEGWADYAVRLKNLSYVSWQYALRVPYWSGEDLADKHLVVWADQGLGEQLLTASILGDAARLCGSITFACDPRLVTLLARSYPDVRIVPLTALKDRGPDLGQIDAQATLSELGAILRPDLNAFPPPTAFLKPDPARVAAFQDRLKAEGQPLVGISWRSENALAGAEKSTSLKDHWSGLLQTEQVRFISLQYGETPQEIAAMGIEIQTIPELDPTQDVDGFTALVAAMDAVVSTSNTTVHVSGGLGIPTLAILPKAYGRPWYWFDQGDTSPWYQNLALVRSSGDWRQALSVARAELPRLLG